MLKPFVLDHTDDMRVANAVVASLFRFLEMYASLAEQRTHEHQHLPVPAQYAEAHSPDALPLVHSHWLEGHVVLQMGMTGTPP